MIDELNIRAPYISTNIGYLKPQKYMKGLKTQIESEKSLDTPLGAQLELTYRCNHRCIHCYNNSADSKWNYDGMLNVDNWKDICRQLNDLNIVQCVISGGEPLLMGDSLFEIMDILHENKVKFVFISNGMLLTEEKIHYLKKYQFDWFQLSIDGCSRETFKKMRGVDGFGNAINALHLLRKANIPITIAHAVTKVNYHELEDMVDFAYQVGATKLVISPFELVGRAILNSGVLELSDEEYKAVYIILKKKINEYSGRMEISVPPESVVSMHSNLYKRNSIMLVRPNGDVKFDCLSPFTIGNVRTNSLKELWNDLGKDVNEHPRVIEYASQITDYRNFATVKPRINIDDDELLRKEG